MRAMVACLKPLVFWARLPLLVLQQHIKTVQDGDTAFLGTAGCVAAGAGGILASRLWIPPRCVVGIQWLFPLSATKLVPVFRC